MTCRSTSSRDSATRWTSTPSGPCLGGRVVLVGNVNPMLIHSGTPEDVRCATRTVIEKLGPYRGLIIQDGNNIPPGTPLENINAMMEAAESCPV